MTDLPDIAEHVAEHLLGYATARVTNDSYWKPGSGLVLKEHLVFDLTHPCGQAEIVAALNAVGLDVDASSKAKGVQIARIWSRHPGLPPVSWQNIGTDPGETLLRAAYDCREHWK